MNCLQPKVSPEQIADEDDHWFCPLCAAHGELIHYAQQQFLGDDYFITSSPPREWEGACDVFPEAEFELSVAQKLKDDIRDEEVDQFLSGALGVQLSLHKPNNAPLEFDNQDDDSSDEDFDSESHEEGDRDSSDEDSLEEEKKLLKEKIHKDELDALSVEDSDSASSDNSAHDRRSRRTRSSRHASADPTHDSEEDSDSSEEKPDVGTLDIANM